MIRALAILLFLFVAMQFIRPEKVEYKKDLDTELKAPEEIRQILLKACYDCHSNELKYPWYSNVDTYSWFVGNNTT